MNIDQPKAIPATQLHRIDGYAPREFARACPPCTGNCNQGRTCSTRQACELPESEVDEIGFVGKAVVVAMAIAAILCALSPILFGAVPR